MRELATDGARDPEVRNTALGVLRMCNVDPSDTPEALLAIFEFVRDRIRFVGDGAGRETLQSPRATLLRHAGDCEDRATLYVALALAAGIGASFDFRVVAVNPAHRESFSHVYVVAVADGRQIAIDPTHPENQIGWEPPNAYRQVDVMV